MPFSMPADTIFSPWASTALDLRLLRGAATLAQLLIARTLEAPTAPEDGTAALAAPAAWPTFGRTEGTNAVVEPMAAPTRMACSILACWALLRCLLPCPLAMLVFSGAKNAFGPLIIKPARFETRVITMHTQSDDDQQRSERAYTEAADEEWRIVQARQQIVLFRKACTHRKVWSLFTHMLPRVMGAA